MCLKFGFILFLHMTNDATDHSQQLKIYQLINLVYVIVKWPMTHDRNPCLRNNTKSKKGSYRFYYALFSTCFLPEVCRISTGIFVAVDFVPEGLFPVWKKDRCMCKERVDHFKVLLHFSFPTIFLYLWISIFFFWSRNSILFSDILKFHSFLYQHSKRLKIFSKIN